MSIKSSEQSVDMSDWVEEKSDGILKEVGRIVELIKLKKFSISGDEDEFIRAMFSIVCDASKLSSFGHESMNGWSHDWVELMLNQGIDRCEEYINHLESRSPSSKPSENPHSVQTVLDQIKILESSLLGDNITIARKQILETSRKLLDCKFSEARQLGDAIIDLVDEQCVNATIDWPTFRIKTEEMLVHKREKIDRELKEYLNPITGSNA